MKHLPNILTGGRLALSLFVFLALAAAGGAAGVRLDAGATSGVELWAFVAFVVAAVTDFFDGWLARRWNVVSVWGAILDPIADKVLICAAVLGLMALHATAAIVIPSALILFREFAVSALREVTAGKGVSLPVTLLAKWKTTVQLIALGAELIAAAWPAFGLPAPWLGPAAVGAHTLLWIAAIVTLITGAQYLAQARKALAA
jgi:CDP-diacylglycerol--glycerol-3-phosphate 3-phosphatidyltransferase